MITNTLRQKITPLIELSKSLSGHLKEREVQFLATLPFLKLEGDILEIGSFTGKSTIIIAKASELAGNPKIYACDPLSLPSSTDPTSVKKEDLPKIFHDNICAHGLNKVVEFSQMKSEDLAKIWDNSLKILWIDGDHTYTGAMKDIELYEKYLKPGAIVCFHDVLHQFEGPARVFMERIILSNQYGDCGFCGSIGWGQFIGHYPVTEKQWKTKLLYYRKLSRLMLLCIKKDNGLRVNKHLRRFYRSLIPHGPILPDVWISKRNMFFQK